MRALNLRWAGFFLCCSAFAFAILSPASSVQSAPKTVSYPKQIVPLLKKYCIGCHGGKDPTAGLSLSKYADEASVLKGRDVWQNVASNVANGHMPPKGMPQPTVAERTFLSNWIAHTLSSDCKVPDPGKVTIRRLNRQEYDNTIRDLLGVDFQPAKDFPSDDVGYGFDNIGDVLSISPLLTEKYLNAAEKIAQKAITTPESRVAVYDGLHLRSGSGSSFNEEGDFILSTVGTVATQHAFPVDGNYKIKVVLYGQQAGPDPVIVDVLLDKQKIQHLEVRATAANPLTVEYPLKVTAGQHQIGVQFLNDYYNSTDPNPANRDRNLVVRRFEIVGPTDQTMPVSPVQTRIIPPGSTRSDTRSILAKFASRAYRRPVRPEEVERLVKVANMAEKEGESFEKGIQLGVMAVLVSPNFLFRVELDPGVQAATAPTRDLNNYELASRLSYFLWSSMPDDELTALAAKGELSKPAVLEAQVKRMLADPKSRSLADDFASQWLQLRKLSIVAPDKQQFPEFNDALRADMATETKMFFQAMVKEDRSVFDFITGKFTYVNGRLAKLYGIPGIEGDDFQKVELVDPNRAGVLSQASVLTVTSNPTRTSPVKRGKWVLENILGTPPPPPPPGVGVLADDAKSLVDASLRQRLEEHRKNPECASCHARMDGLGFAMENFDAVGKWRTTDGKYAVDAAGVLPDGSKFKGPNELRSLLLKKKDLFLRCLSEKLLTFAIGRGVESYDSCALDDISKSVAKKGYKFSSMIQAVVSSDPFRKRRTK